MIIEENLLWILDRIPSKHQQMSKEEEYQQNINFVHSLGLKCDCVGWSTLDLTRPDTSEILDRIEAFCKEDGWLARGNCSRTYKDFDSDWYELKLPEIEGINNYHKVPCDDGTEVTLHDIRAYQNNNAYGMFGYPSFFVSEHFRDSCIQHQVPGVQFCWVRDTGRYASTQYYTIYPDKCLPWIACDHFLNYSESRLYDNLLSLPHHPGSELYHRLEVFGGHFPRLAEIFYDMRFSFPDYYPISELPEEGFVRVYWGKGGYWGRNKLLIHRKTAEMLLEEKAISKKNLAPVFLYQDDQVPAGYYVEKMSPVPKPAQAYFAQMQEAFETFIQTPRPVRKTTPKEAVSLLRKAKTARKTDFQKRMKKEIAARLEDTPYAPLMPYYLIADGGYLSDDYCLLSYAETKTATAEFIAAMEREELADLSTEGIIIARCPDGDNVILRPSGIVEQISHEVPDVTEDWPTLAQFFADCIEQEE